MTRTEVKAVTSGAVDTPPEDLPATLSVQLLGGFRVRVGSHDVPDRVWRLRKSAAVIKLLALSESRALHREQMLDLLWPDLDPKAAVNNLHYVLHAARRALSPLPGSILQFQGDLLVLNNPGPLWIDVAAFEEAAARARRARDPAEYRAAKVLYTGSLLPEDLYEDWVGERREALHSLYVSLLLEQAGIASGQGDIVAATEALQSAVQAEPALEEAHVDLMRLYARAGQRQQALRQYRQLERVLKQELDVEPSPAGRELYQTILEGKVSFPVPTEPPVSRTRDHNLPAPLTSFVGRKRELTEAKRILSTARLLTIAGPGGVGKTRLAVQLARDVIDEYADGVWMVELAAVGDPQLVPAVVAQTLQIPERADVAPTQALRDALRDRHMLLMLDNCEHLASACAVLVETLLYSCPQLSIVVTSREFMGVSGEVSRRMPALSLPPEGDLPDLVELLHYDAVRLLVDRVQYRDPTFELTLHDASAIVRICRQLDGIPLAIELAAVRVGALSLDQIADRLHSALTLLTTGSRTAQPRQQTLRATLDWSYELLDLAEQALFRRLSVFRGGWTLEQAEAAGSSLEQLRSAVLDVLSRLVDKSLVATDSDMGSGIRYRLLEPVRQYAHERLVEQDEADDALQQHASIFFALGEQANQGINGPDQKMWLECLEIEHDNCRAVLHWSRSGGDRQLGLQLASSIWMFWYMHGYLREGEEWLASLLAVNADAPSHMRAAALQGLGGLRYAQRKYDAAMGPYEEALRLHREQGNTHGVAASLGNLAMVYRAQEDYSKATALQRQSLTLRQEMGDRRGVATALLNLAAIAHVQGDLPEAQRLCEEHLAICREEQDAGGVATSLNNLGEVVFELGDVPRADGLFREALQMGRDLGLREVIVACLDNLAYTSYSLGHHARSARLHAAAAAERQTMGMTLYPGEVPRWEQRMAALRQTLGSGFDQAWTEANQWSRETAIDYALGNEPLTIHASAGVVASDGVAGSVLTAREWQVAELIVKGLTNRQIAQRLGMAERTADTHVGKILKKLDLSSRGQVGDWLTRHTVT